MVFHNDGQQWGKVSLVPRHQTDHERPTHQQTAELYYPRSPHELAASSHTDRCRASWVSRTLAGHLGRHQTLGHSLNPLVVSTEGGRS
ncbi:hypothetical protein ElyMa_006034600 [Elysia marginata]|uniref:Uncharacterized protein n=1 Tax=Elysia marginata TaxID=1093978 RepID=A0AAV4GJ27_9GAST|nr:hypothetical protein ElyMa_006034600 [Elysia marginata]